MTQPSSYACVSDMTINLSHSDKYRRGIRRDGEFGKQLLRGPLSFRESPEGESGSEDFSPPVHGCLKEKSGVVHGGLRASPWVFTSYSFRTCPNGS